jgi:hypothetical protein
MKRFSSIVALTFLLLVSIRGQARKLETIPWTHADNEMAYLDLLAKELGDDSSLRGVLIGYRKSDLSPGAFLRRVYGYEYYLVNMRGIDSDRIQIIEGDVKPQTFTEMWLVPAGAPPPVADSQLNLVPKLPLQFDVAFPDCPSEMTVYLEEMADYLRFYARAMLANRTVTAKIVAYPGRRSTVRKVARIASQARSQLAANYHIDGKRVVTITRNRRRDCSQLELWLTPSR